MIKTYYKNGDSNFSNKIFFSDESHFTLGFYVNKQNYRIWDFENPQINEERPLHPEEVTVWCCLWSKVVENYFKRINASNLLHVEVI